MSFQSGSFFHFCLNISRRNVLHRLICFYHLVFLTYKNQSIDCGSFWGNLNAGTFSFPREFVEHLVMLH